MDLVSTFILVMICLNILFDNKSDRLDAIDSFLYSFDDRVEEEVEYQTDHLRSEIDYLKDELEKLKNPTFDTTKA